MQRQHTQNIPATSDIQTDDQLRNVNSFEYLCNLSHFIPSELQNTKGFGNVHRYCSNGARYNPNLTYGDFYTAFLLALEQQVIQLKKSNNTDKLQELDTLINAVYNNDNLALERSYEVIKADVERVRQTNSSQMAKAFRSHLESSDKKNATSPLATGSFFGRMSANFSHEFKPMTTTSQPSLVKLSYQSQNGPLQFRFGTQGQSTNYAVSVNPVFEQWLVALKNLRTEAPPQGFDLVYFNNLSRIGMPVPVWKGRERFMTNSLESLEQRFDNIAVITLPANKTFMSYGISDKREKPQTSNMGDVGGYMLTIAKGQSYDQHKHDLYISDAVKKLLYGVNANGTYSTENETRILTELLEKSFALCGFNMESKLSSADQQAVYMHFIKFELTDFILSVLRPRGFSFSCKDAIDRGGVSSAYYNLMKSIQRRQPISQDDFQRLLHAAPMLVKGRGINKYSHLVWNTVDALIEGNQKPDSALSIPSWLVQWRNQHAIPGTLHYYANLLTNYMEKRDLEAEEHKEEKLGVAQFILTQLHKVIAISSREGGVIRIEGLSYEQMRTAGDGRLGDMVEEMEERGLIKLVSQRMEHSGVAPSQRG